MAVGKKYGGRQKGTPNKRTQFSVRERLEELGVDLVGEILKCIENVDDDNDKAHLYLRLLEYCDAKRKAMEVKVEDMNQMTKEEALTLGREAIKVLEAS